MHIDPDQLNSVVTDAAVRAIMQTQGVNERVARLQVGDNAEAFLRSVIDQRVAAGGNRELLEQALEGRYLAPARRLLETMAGEPEPEPDVL